MKQQNISQDGSCCSQDSSSVPAKCKSRKTAYRIMNIEHTCKCELAVLVVFAITQSVVNC